MSTDTMRAPPLGSPLPADVARCPGYWADGELREGCDDCLRRTSPSPTDRVVWMAPPIAAPSPTIPAGQTRSQKLTAAGFTRRPSLWAREAREALELIAAPMRPDGTWNRDREACRQLAAEALGRSEDAPTPLTERIVYPKIPPRKIQDDDEQPAPQEPTP